MKQKKPPTGSNRKGAVLITSGHKLVVTRSELVTKGGHKGQASGVNHQKHRENMVFFAWSHPHTPQIYSLMAFGNLPDGQRLSGGAKAGGMGKSGEAVEARRSGKNMRNGYIAIIC